MQLGDCQKTKRRWCRSGHPGGIKSDAAITGQRDYWSCCPKQPWRHSNHFLQTAPIALSRSAADGRPMNSATIPPPFSGIVRTDSGASSVRIVSRSIAESSNRLSIEFQDEENEFQQDSLSLVDSADSALIGYEVVSQSTALGVANYNQATRVLRRQLDKTLKGNLFVEFQTSFPRSQSEAWRHHNLHVFERRFPACALPSGKAVTFDELPFCEGDRSDSQ